MTRDYIQITIAAVRDGICIEGLRLGYLAVEESQAAYWIELSNSGRLYPWQLKPARSFTVGIVAMKVVEYGSK